MIDLINCPVFPAQLAVLDSSRTLVRDLSRLRKAMKNCRLCPSSEDCPLIQEVNAQLSAALAQVYELYGLGQKESPEPRVDAL